MKLQSRSTLYLTLLLLSLLTACAPKFITPAE